MDRRTFIQYSAASLALGACKFSDDEPLSPSKANVLFIAIDDLNTWIGCMRHIRQGIPIAHTPNIDRLAAQGTLFTNAHTPVPWCMPARNNLFTGLYANHSGIYSHELFRDFLPNIKTLPQHFMDHGYTALAGGKLFHDTYPDLQSWHEYTQFNRPPSQKRQTPSLSGVVGIDPTDGFDWGQIALPEQEYTDVQIADWAIASLNRQFDKPFFMGVGFRFPHLPWYLPKELLDLYPLESIQLPWVKEDDLDDVPEAAKAMAFANPFASEATAENSDHSHLVNAGAWKKAVQAYLAAVTFADAQLGRVLGALDASQYAQNTHVVFWSDNGFHLGEKLHWRKFTLWDQATRVPLIIKAASQLGAGQRIDQAVSLVDIYPTLSHLCGLPLPAHALSGSSLTDFFVNPSAVRTTPAIITYGKGNDSVVDQRWRYIRYADGSEELYDHDNDPQEWTNIANESIWVGEKNRLASWLKA